MLTRQPKHCAMQTERHTISNIHNKQTNKKTNTMNAISDILYWISTGLLVPVIVLLIILFIRALLLIGKFFGQYLTIRRNGAELRMIMDNAEESGTDVLHDRLKNGNSPVFSCMRLMLEYRDSPARLRKIISDYELDAEKDMAISRTLSKMGPMLGLMGTLIPMGPALVGLSTGDISSMAYNMQVAFATTVVGLFSAAIGFITLQVKQRWYTRDLIDLEFLQELLEEDRNE